MKVLLYGVLSGFFLQGMAVASVGESTKRVPSTVKEYLSQQKKEGLKDLIKVTRQDGIKPNAEADGDVAIRLKDLPRVKRREALPIDENE